MYKRQPYYLRFIDALPTVQSLAAASEDRVLKLWEGLGYYTRARNLHKAARIIVYERNGRFPQTSAEWRELPGVGRYTAGAISSIVFGERVAVLDGNVKRVLSRLFDVCDCIDDHSVQASLWALAESLVPIRSPGSFNEAMMELGARICLPRQPQCTVCPVRKVCDALQAGVQEDRPVRAVSKKTPHIEMVAAVLSDGAGHYLIGKRPAEIMLGGLWEFPCEKVEPGETHLQALQRGLKQSLGIKVSVRGALAVVEHAYSHFSITLHVYRCEIKQGTPEARFHTDLQWTALTNISRYALPKANLKFLHLLS